MNIDSIITALTQKSTEQLLIYLPAFVIGFGALVIGLFYLKDNWLSLIRKLSGIKESFRTEPGKNRPHLAHTIDYKKEAELLSKSQNTESALSKLHVMINQYIGQLLNLHHSFTYDELISELDKTKNTRLKEFCEKLTLVEFSKDEVTKEELESVAKEFIEITKKHPLARQEAPETPKKSKFLIRILRFKKELQRDLEKKKTVQEKVDHVVGKSASTIWASIKGKFVPTTVPKKLSFEAVLTDARNKQAKQAAKSKDEDHKTLEWVFYFAYLTIRKKLIENKRINEINELIQKGRFSLTKSKDVIEAKNIYYSIIQLYNTLSDHDKKKMLEKIVIFYDEINETILFQSATICLLNLKMALKSKDHPRALKSYIEVKKVYDQLPAKYKDELYEEFIMLEKEFNMIPYVIQKGGR